MDFVPVVVMAATVKKIVDVLRQSRDARLRDAVMTLAAWVAGAAVVWLTAATPWAAGIEVAGFTLDKLGAAGQALLGISIGSSASVLHDAIRDKDPVVVDPPPAQTSGMHPGSKRVIEQ